VVKLEGEVLYVLSTDDGDVSTGNTAVLGKKPSDNDVNDDGDAFDPYNGEDDNIATEHIEEGSRRGNVAKF